MEHNPSNPDRPLSDEAKFGERGTYTSNETSTRASGISADPGDRTSEAFADASGTLGRESLGGGESTIDEMKEGARDSAQQIKEKASTFKASLADKLEAGAEKLRQKSSAETASSTTGNVQKMGDKVASGMESTAEWLRTADLQSIQKGIEGQVRENPGRTLLIALGVGYLLGRALGGKGSGGGS